MYFFLPTRGHRRGHSTMTRRLFRSGVGVVVAAALWVASSVLGVDAQAVPTPPLCWQDPPCQLTVGLPGAQAIAYVIAPNGARVVFVHGSTDLVDDLYSAPVGGGAFPTKLDLPGADAISGAVISPDSTRVIYSATIGSNPPALFSVPINGPASANVRLANDVTGSPQISPDSRKVVLRSTVGGLRLRAVPIAGPAKAGVRLTDPFIAAGTLGEFKISADSKSVVYRGAQDTAAVDELYRVPLTLSPEPNPLTVKLNAPLPPGGGVTSFVLSANNGPVFYRAEQDTDGVFELYRVGFGGSGRVKLSRPLPPGWDVVSDGTVGSGQRIGYSSVPDGTRVIYEIQNSLDATQRELHSVPTAGPANAGVRLDGASATSTEMSYLVTPDSSQVVYNLAGDDGLTWGYRVPVAGPAPASTLITWPSSTSHLFTLSPDSNHIVWKLDPGAAGADPTLMSTPLDETVFQSVRLNGDEIPEMPMLVNANSTRVVYRERGEQVEHLYSASIDATGNRYNRTEALDPIFTERITLTPNGVSIVYSAKQTSTSGLHLYISRIVPRLLPPT
jgi:hypothetical protein